MNETELAKDRKRQTKNVFSSINFAVYTKRPNIFARLSKIAGFSYFWHLSTVIEQNTKYLQKQFIDQSYHVALDTIFSTYALHNERFRNNEYQYNSRKYLAV